MKTCFSVGKRKYCMWMISLSACCVTASHRDCVFPLSDISHITDKNIFLPKCMSLLEMKTLTRLSVNMLITTLLRVFSVIRALRWEILCNQPFGANVQNLLFLY